MIREYKESHEHLNRAVVLLYLRTTIDPKAHLMLKAQINSLAIVTLIDSGAIGVFMHPNFA